MSTTDLPALNATLNAISAVLLLCGLWAIRGGRKELHRKFMIGALAASAIFLVTYLWYHALHGSTLFLREGPVRVVYFAILISHIILAAINLPLVVLTAYRAFIGDFERHKKIARVTWVMWMYVSVTGVLVYLMLYRWFPGKA
jgi:uncharacterized membrane protein YozB (DUF420 family)